MMSLDQNEQEEENNKIANVLTAAIFTETVYIDGVRTGLGLLENGKQ